MLRILIGGALGAVIGAIIGYVGKCSGGACPLTCNPIGGTLVGFVIGILLATSGALAPHSSTGPVSPNLIEVRDGKHFQDLLTVHKVVLVDFYADWCGPCRRLKPILGEIADAYVGRAVTVSVNVDHLKDVAELYGVSGVPDVRVFVDGKISEVIVGLRTREAYVNALEKAGIPRKAG